MIENVEIGIANFKPFGEKIQRFKLKPITLVFGPNSIGKSSVIHSVAYMQSIFKNQELNPSEIFFGDKISIGGFSHFVHKKETEREITLEYKFDTDAIPLNANTINNLRRAINRDRENQIKKLKEKEALKIKLLNYSNQELKNDLLRDAVDFKDHGAYSEIMQKSVIDFFETIDYLEEWKEISEKEKQKGWENKPKEDLKYFLNNASQETKKFFKSLSPLYIFDPEDTTGEWLIFNRFLFVDKLLEADVKTIDSLVNDIKKELQSKWKEEDIDWDIPDAIDDSITIKIKVGQFDGEMIQDIQIQYYVSNELLMEANRIKNPIEENSDEIDKMKQGISKIINNMLVSSGVTPNGTKKYNPSIFDIKLISSHWLVLFAIESIKKDGGWEEDKDSELNEETSKDIYSYVDDTIHYKFKDIQTKSTILFDYAAEDKIDTLPLYNWTYECENSEEPTKKLLEADFTEYMESRTYDSEYDLWESDYWEDDRITKNANLYEFLEKSKYGNEINSINDVLIFLFYDWVQNINTVLKNDDKVLHYVGPLRSFPERHEFSFPEKQENTNNSKSVWQQIKDNDEVKDKLNLWLGSKKLKTPYELKIQKYIQANDFTIEQMKEIFQKDSEDSLMHLENKIPHIIEMSFHDKRYNTQVNIREMGLGVSQVLPILVNLFQKEKNLIAIEQPELHLHPAVQSDLADEFIKSYKNNNNEFLIETHSEHLLLRIMRRMRQTAEDTLDDENLALTPDDVSLLYVDADDNKTYILELELAEDGSLLDPWPGGFFEEGFRERFL